MTKRRIAVVVSARPSYARIKTVLAAVRGDPRLELYLVTTASALLDKYGDVGRVIEQDGFRIDERVYSVLEGENTVAMAKTTGLALLELATVFDRARPDVVITVADRFETIATAIAAAYQNIPLAHIQGGEVTGSIDEKVRHAVTKLADVHFPSTRLAGERIRRMGEDPDRIHVTGCPSIDLAAGVMDANTDLPDIFSRYSGVGEVFGLEGRFVIVMQHSVTTEHERAMRQIEATLRAVHELDLPTLWFWPNVDAGSDGVSRGIRRFREQAKPRKMHFFKNMPPEDFLALLNRSACIVGNSSVAIREASYLGIPAVDIGTRQGGREAGPNVLAVDHDSDLIRDAIERQLAHGRYDSVHLYGDGKAGPRIAELLATLPLPIDKKLVY